MRNFGSVIAEEDKAHIFERFYRGDKARSSRGGHGLGLPIIRQMTELLGGEIRAESSEADGTAMAGRPDERRARQSVTPSAMNSLPPRRSLFKTGRP